MYKIEVDPKLFITCRLCLDEMGQYQIVPNVQAQIKFCFDIDVDPFDGLPQLICKKCETILSDFHEKKKTYQEKQLGLKKNAKPNCIVVVPLQQQDTVSSTQSSIPETKPQQSFKLTLKKKPISPEPNLNDSIVIKNHDTKTVRPWRKNYNKYFACKFCEVVYRNKKILITHMEKHSALLEKYGHILKKCKIQLPRIDEKTNFVSSNDMVVMDENHILLNKYDQYRVMYIQKSSSHRGKKNSSDSSDDDTSKRKRKRLRLVSQSSNETVVLEDPIQKDLEKPGSSKNKLQNNVIECVDIDSSDHETPSPKTYEGPKKIIREVVASCVKKYLNNDNDKSRDIQLKHKILSIGRKIVNNKSFNCNGLLRYLEHKNLDIEWNPRVSQNPETECVHIRTKVQDNKNDTEPRWVIASGLTGSDGNTYMENLQKILVNDEFPTPDANSTQDSTIEQMPNDNGDKMLLKLLKTNSVANPKVKKTETTKSVSSSGENLSMPIITNTVSLADAVSEQVNDKPNEPIPFVPRIKVKSASQLMADKSTNKTITETTPAQVAWTIPEKPQNQFEPEWVVMHTVELPRTKTLSPFKYFQNLLQMHGITLLDTTALVPNDFVSLIKFKSVFKQETKRVTLSLGLLSDSKQFYIKVTESTNEQLDINTLIPTWQWEILSLYKSEIATNILENSKKISQKMYESTNYFVSLLRSIVFKRS
ncbi:uncharacterized protein LOC111003143 isoform X2 [Pieris rapae]|nr:uncharacterized protein LOC111003143 isoform X2 [Pieris rapae]XP_022129201.2 uncharacterized protein LOC111003143 isoform X2 [Pieris rapae]XP_022129202.2 uncharacterized protein LOC111003143 isoform X2 [Pieris rapae]XP_045489425.1 uncharacterized protein LOC111003143 isoform X2 [Pieris rapae]